MKFKSPLRRGRFLRRYKRFFADIAFPGGETVTAHCPNPGAMLGLTVEGADAFLSLSDDPKRRLPYTLELLRVGTALVGINTLAPNRIVSEALAKGALPPLAAYETVQREVRYGAKSRVDFLLESAGRPSCFLEVKNVHLMRQDGLAEFPDCVTDRGTRHLVDLAAMAQRGYRSVILFLVQRGDCTAFSLAADLDPAYAKAFATACAAGVEALCYDCTLSEHEITLRRALPFVDKAGTATC